MANSSSTKPAQALPARNTDLFLRRDAAGNIVSLRNTADEAHAERSDTSNAEVRAYLGLDSQTSAALDASDADLVRVLDDLVDLMIQKQLIRFTELPAAAQEKLLHRRRLRDALSGHSLLDSHDNSGIL